MARVPATGAVASNLHEGSRSEYLAQYVFSMFGTSVPVPHQEDHGIDLYCTLLERRGRRAWPVAYYSVQVRSNHRPWVFNTPESVQWLIEYPMPLFYSVVEKDKARVRVYHTLSRFMSVTTSEKLPRALSLVPGRGTESMTMIPPNADQNQISLGAPILQFTIDELLDTGRFDAIRNVLQFWILIDLANVHRYQTGMWSARAPFSYTVNEIPREGGVSYYRTYASLELRTKAETNAAELLEWLAQPRYSDGDLVGTLLALLAVRHSDREWTGPHASPFVLLRPFLAETLRAKGEGQFFAGINQLLEELREELAPN
jgi:hypothetical protein